jgi:hypothetical protein
MNDSNEEKYSKDVLERAKSFKGRAGIYLNPDVEQNLLNAISKDLVDLENHYIAGACSEMAEILKYVQTHKGEYKQGDEIRSYFEELKNLGSTGLKFGLFYALIYPITGSSTHDYASSATLTFSINIPGQSDHSGGGGTGYIHQNDCVWYPAP